METGQSEMIASFEHEGKGPLAKEYRKTLGTGKNKETDFPLETPERKTALTIP